MNIVSTCTAVYNTFESTTSGTKFNKFKILSTVPVQCTGSRFYNCTRVPVYFLFCSQKQDLYSKMFEYFSQTRRKWATMVQQQRSTRVRSTRVFVLETNISENTPPPQSYREFEARPFPPFMTYSFGQNEATFVPVYPDWLEFDGSEGAESIQGVR